VELITSDQRDELFATFERDAFHLELRDAYHVAGEDDPFHRWLNGWPDDGVWQQPWLSRIRRATRSGRTVRRVRVVTEPLTDYIRWEHAVTAANQEAGEDIRWLPRHLVPSGIAWPLRANDWWLFDDRLLAVGHLRQDGSVLGSELIDDPRTVSTCARLRDQLWVIAVPHAQYAPF
jgi:hypothetical protein